MRGSRTIQVFKRDGSVEPFDVGKLTGSMWRALKGTGAEFDHARRLAEAVAIYIRRRKTRCVSSMAIFEMVVKAFHHVGLSAAAVAAERWRGRRDRRRARLMVRQDNGQLTQWDKRWVWQLAGQSWHVSPMTARILAGRVELAVLRRSAGVVSRSAVVDLLNETTSQYGLADAVPVQQ